MYPEIFKKTMQKQHQTSKSSNVTEDLLQPNCSSLVKTSALSSDSAKSTVNWQPLKLRLESEWHPSWFGEKNGSRHPESSEG